MDIVRHHSELQPLREGWRGQKARVGLVPTMGALHQGHVALMRAARKTCDKVIVTIFVNPLQFGEDEDGASYPRQETQDIALLKKEQIDALYLPAVQDMYPAGFATQLYVTGSMNDILCGAHRRGHFAGVTLIIAKLFALTSPDDAFFGEKDYQQYCIIRRMTADLNMPVRIHAIATVREDDGLACSSRNAYLDEAQRAVAPQLYAMLTHCATLVSAGEMKWKGKDFLMDAGFAKVEYISLVEAETLHPLAVREKGARLCAAAHLGKARLIDNIKIE